MFSTIWTFVWSFGWLGFIGMLAYTILGLIVFFNTVAHTPDTPKFFRFLFFCTVCGPAGWISFPFWFVYQLCSHIEIKQIGYWLAGQQSR